MGAGIGAVSVRATDDRGFPDGRLSAVATAITPSGLQENSKSAVAAAPVWVGCRRFGRVAPIAANARWASPQGPLSLQSLGWGPARGLTVESPSPEDLCRAIGLRPSRTHEISKSPVTGAAVARLSHLDTTLGQPVEAAFLERPT